MKKRLSGAARAAALSALIVFAPGALPAQTDTAHMDQGTNRMMKSGDATFAIKAAQGGMAEVKLGQLAVQKASNPGVKSFGQRMVDDHSKANEQLKSIAGKDSMTLPNTLGAKDQELYNKLSTLSGGEFDRAYMKAMVKDHEEDIKEFQKEASKGTNPGIKNFASTTLPTLQEHLQMAKSTEQKLRASGS
jgi:putative membrane protein